MAHRTHTATRHKEYSLLFGCIALSVLVFFSGTEQFSSIVLVNIVSLVGILASAFSVVRHADVLAHRFGEPYGSLILTLAVIVLEVSLISILMISGETAPTLLRDTLYSIIMIVLCGLTGIALLLGGRKYSTQHLNLAGIKQYLISIIPLSIVVLILPVALKGESYAPWQLVLVSLFCVAVYAIFITIQTKTHQSLFIYDDEDEDDAHHGKPSPHSNAWHALWLIVHLFVVIALTKLNASFLNALLTSLDAPSALSGFLIAFLTLSPEGLGAIKAVLNKQVQRGMNLLFGSVIATISLTVPIVALISMLSSKTLVLGLDIENIILLFAILLLCQSSFSTGKTNALNGVAHLVIFGAYLMMMFN